MDTLMQDLRYAARGLRKASAFTGVAVMTLALGIGAATVMISVLYHVLFRTLPYRDVDRMVTFNVRDRRDAAATAATAGERKERSTLSVEEIIALRESHRDVFDDVMGWRDRTVLNDDGASTRLFRGAEVTANGLELLGVAPLIGRGLMMTDGDDGAAPVFVMNHRLWRTEFGSEASLLGKTFALNGEPRTLVGVMPPRFDAFHADVWIPLQHRAKLNGLTPIGRLADGVSMAAAASRLDATVRPFLDSVIGGFKKTLYILLAAVALLVLIACSNVANLLLTRATVRDRETAIRAALGATRGRLIRHLCAESLLLAALAAIAGCVLGYVGLKVVVALMPADLISMSVPSGTAPATLIGLNGPVLLLSLAVSIATAIICTIAPALHISMRRARARHGHVRAALVVTQVALSMLLLIGAGLLMRSFVVLTTTDLGFNPRNVLYVRPWFPKEGFESKEQQNLFTRELLRRMKALPDVESVAESMLVPPLTYDWSDTIIPGKPHADRWETRIELCSEGFFQTLGVSLVRGRLFSEADVEDARRFVVINQAFARRYFGGEDPLGRTVKFAVLDRPFLDAPHDTYFEIVGIVSDYKTRANEWQTMPQAFLPYSVQGFSYRTFLARTRDGVDPALVSKGVEQEVWAINPHVGIRNTGTIEGSLREYYRPPQFKLATLGTFATVSLLLVVMGVFSVMAYAVSLRRQEIGIRMAIGARQIDIVRTVLARGFTLVCTGLAIGLVASYALTGILASEISEVSATDPWTFGSVITIIALAGLLACVPPARRAMNVDPLVALRHE